MRREVLGEPGDCHWRIRRVEVLIASDQLRSSELDFDMRLDELRVMAAFKRITTTRRGGAEITAFRTFQNNVIGVRDLSARPASSFGDRQAPFQINR